MMRSLIYLGLLVASCSFLSISKSVSLSWDSFTASSPDTLSFGNVNFFSNGSSTIWYDQSPLIFTSPVNGRLVNVKLRFQSITNLNSNLSRLFVKSDKSWSCTGLAEPIIIGTYTLGVSTDINPVGGSWNEYGFSTPINVVAGQKYYIWPDPTRQISHRLSFADTPSSNDIGLLFASTCSNNAVNTNDYAAILNVEHYSCLSRIDITASDSSCYLADTLYSSASISAGDSIRYNFGTFGELEIGFQVDQNAVLEMQEINCDN